MRTLKNNTIIFQHDIVGYLTGYIWMPAVECFKEFSYNINAQEKRWSEKGTLRNHVDVVVNDGDFQSCKIGNAELRTTMTIVRNGKRYITYKYRDLQSFPSIVDYIEKDWYPPYND